MHRSVEFLLDHLPASLRLVLASRTDPPLPLARLRARGQLAELRAADLRFTAERGGRAAAARRRGATCPTRVVAALGERTEGWAAGLQLAALSLQGRRRRRRVRRGVLRQPPLRAGLPGRGGAGPAARRSCATFLLETSVLERLSGRAVRRGDRAHRTASSCWSRSSGRTCSCFRWTTERRWWRYHHLFADLLRARLPREDPHPGRRRCTAPRRLVRAPRAARRRHPARTGGGRRGAGRRGSSRRTGGPDLARAARARRWTAGWPPLPAEVVRVRPRLALGQAIVALLGGRLDEVEPLLTLAEQAYAASGGEPYAASVDRSVSVLANVPATLATCRADLARLRGDGETERAHAQAALTHMRPDDALLASVARYHLAVGDWLAGRLDAAEKGLLDVASEHPLSAERHIVLRATYDLGGVQQAQGRLGAALRTYERGLEAAARLPNPASAGMPLVGLAEVAFQRDELVAAREHATAGVERCRRLAHTAPLVTGLLTLARIRWAEGDRARARAALDEAAAVMPVLEGLRNPVPAAQVRLALAAGDVTEAARVVRAWRLPVDVEPAYAREHEYLALVRLSPGAGQRRRRARAGRAVARAGRGGGPRRQRGRAPDPGRTRPPGERRRRGRVLRARRRPRDSGAGGPRPRVRRRRRPPGGAAARPHGRAPA